MYSNNFHDYKLKIELAKCCEGKFGLIFLAQYIPNKHFVAVKELDLESETDIEFNAICKEINLIQQIKHPNIHNIVNCFVWKTSIYIVSPLMCFGSCKDTINSCFKTGFPEILVALILRDVLLGLAYMHHRGYIHCSIRASHILLNQTKAVLSCFRESRSMFKNGRRLSVLHGLSSNSKNSINWLAPEVLEQNLNGFTEKSDIYSLGVTGCELANGICPYSDMQPTYIYTEKIRGNSPTLLDQSTCLQVENTEINCNNSNLKRETQEIYARKSFSDEFHQFIEICVNRLQSNRWSALQLINHAFFKQCRNTSISVQTAKFGLCVCDYSVIEDEDLKNKYYANNEFDESDFSWNFK